MSYTNWTKRLAGEKVKTFVQPQPDDEGYYRKPVTEMVLGRDGKTNGQRRVIDWIPVAYFLTDPSSADGQHLAGLIGAGKHMRDMTDDETTDESLWSWVCRHPIPYEMYTAVAEGGESWPDLKGKPTVIGTDNTSQTKTWEDYQNDINAAIASAPAMVRSKEDAEEALGIKNRLGELRLEADKIGKSIYEPLYVAYTKEQKPWAAVVKAADVAEKAIRKLVDLWTEKERQRLMAERIEAERAQREEEERLARAADRAIARGEPEEAPEVEQVVLPPTAPEPIQPVYGRKLKQELKTFVTITDEAKVAAYFHGNAELVAVLQKLADRAVKAGVEVPGTATRQGYA